MSKLSDFVPSGKGGGAQVRYQPETHTATHGQTVFDLTNSYQLGYSTLVVVINGVQQSPDPDTYQETNTKRVTLSSGAEAGDRVVFHILQAAEE